MKKILIFFVIFGFCLTAKAQLLGSLDIDPKAFINVNDSSKTNNDMLKNAVRSAFFLSRQSFQVSDKKTGELYGLNNKDEFGTEISLGIKVKNGFVLTDKAMHPWNHNAKFDTYKKDYNPVLYVSEYSEIGENAKYDTLNISQPKAEELLTNSLYYLKSEHFYSKGLTIDCTKGAKDGWIIWICANKESDLNKTSQLELVCYNKPIDTNDMGKINIETPNGQNILGGIYVVPTNTDIGLLEFYLSGIMVENEGKWNLTFPFVGKEKLLNSTSSQNVAQENANKDSLTPVDDVYNQSPKTKKAKESKRK